MKEIHHFPALGGLRDGGTIACDVVPNHRQAMRIVGEQFKHHRYLFDAIRRRFVYVGVISTESLSPVEKETK